MLTIGLDLSLAKTGYSVVKNGQVLTSGLIKSRPTRTDIKAELERLLYIVSEISAIIDGYSDEVKIVAIENLAFMARNTTALTQLAGLSYLVREMLHNRGIHFLMIAPTSLKKFITQKGNSDKSLMMMTVYKDYGFESLDDNVCDSYSLAVLSAAALGSPVKPLSAVQLEVVELIKLQVCQ